MEQFKEFYDSSNGSVVILAGGYSACLTSQQRNEWVEFLRGKKEWETFIAVRQLWERLLARQQGSKCSLEGALQKAQSKAYAAEIALFHVGREWAQEETRRKK